MEHGDLAGLRLRSSVEEHVLEVHKIMDVAFDLPYREALTRVAIIRTSTETGPIIYWTIRRENWPDDLDWPPQPGDMLAITLPRLIGAERPKEDRQ
jgi:hypothetical protein